MGGRVWMEAAMADDGSSGILGVLVGAVLVIVIGFGAMYAIGTVGSERPIVQVELPKPPGTPKPPSD
jgi:hypothetical protein